jgi:hypothetical protein
MYRPGFIDGCRAPPALPPIRHQRAARRRYYPSCPRAGKCSVHSSVHTTITRAFAVGGAKRIGQAQAMQRRIAAHKVDRGAEDIGTQAHQLQHLQVEAGCAHAGAAHRDEVRDALRVRTGASGSRDSRIYRKQRRLPAGRRPCGCSSEGKGSRPSVGRIEFPFRRRPAVVGQHRVALRDAALGIQVSAACGGLASSGAYTCCMNCRISSCRWQ